MNSDAYNLRDPTRIREKRDREQMKRRARAIARLPESAWDETVKREPKDRQEEIWDRLQRIKRGRELGLLPKSSTGNSA